VAKSRVTKTPQCIRLRGVRQNNLKGFDLDLPLGRYIAVTGLSGAGKSSLVFDTLHAEGQRRYVETFSAYTRQFLDLLDKPKVDSIENIRPSIAIQQSNTVKTSRSTVGTMTELTDFFKVWFSHVSACFDPETGEPVEDDTPHSIWEKTQQSYLDQTFLLCFTITRPSKIKWAEIFKNLLQQGYVRVLANGRIHTLAELSATPPEKIPDTFHVVQDRITTSEKNRSRFIEAIEAAMHYGQGQVQLFVHQQNAAKTDSFTDAGRFSRGLHSPKTGRTFRAATPALFSFNSPLGACPKCRGFGRVIDIDYRLALPDQSLSIDEGVIKCWESDIYGESKKDLKVFTKKNKIPTNLPFASLTEEQRDFVIYGEPGYGEANDKTWPDYWYGVKGFFDWLEKNTYKMHVRVFLSRYRTYNTCPECEGTRLQPEALCWRWRGYSLPQLYQLPVGELLDLVAASSLRDDDQQTTIAYESLVTRLRYLDQVGLGYLTLDRTSRTLSGGEVQRVNLTSCLGTSLVDTLFVLDEPSVGLHPRDIDRLISIIRTLTDTGNTVVVVEHDEAMIKAADHIIEVGPEPGSRGGHIVYEGSVAGLNRSAKSITGAYFSGRENVETPDIRRKVSKRHPSLHFRNVTKHNIEKLSFRIPLGRFVCLSGVSGSGKSTLLENVIHQGLNAHRNLITDDPAMIESIRCDQEFSEIVLVDQSPLSRTPRSNPALYSEAWEAIRVLFASTPEAMAAGFTHSSFSFNSGEGRCYQCQGLGYERVEMQFLSDVYVPCPVCEGQRFKPEVLAIRWQGKSIADLLATSITDALTLFTEQPGITKKLLSLDSVGLGYLTLGQPLNTLSGGESQRLKLVRYLSNISGSSKNSKLQTPNSDQSPALLLLDEPTTGLHRHDVKRLLSVLQALVNCGHSLVVIEHNLDVLKSADWIIEIGPEAGAGGGKIVAEGTPEDILKTSTETAPFLQQAIHGGQLVAKEPEERLVAESQTAYGDKVSKQIAPRNDVLTITGARENNLKNITLEIPHHQLTVVTGVSGSGKSTLAFDIVFAEGQRRFMESMSPYARQFVEQLPRPSIDRLTGIPPTVAIEQRVTRGSRKSTVATITEIAQYLRLLYARMGIQHHPDTDHQVEALSPTQLRRLLTKVLATPQAKRAKHLYLCAPLIRGRKGHHQPIATWIAKQGYELMRADGQLLAAEAFTKLDRYREHDIEVVVADLGGSQLAGARKRSSMKEREQARSLPENDANEALKTALHLGKGSCFLLHPNGEILSWFSTTRTDIESGESFPELDPKHFSFNSPRGWCPSCRGHGRIFPWMLEPEDKNADPIQRLRAFGVDSAESVSDAGSPCPDCEGTRLNRISRAVKLHLKGKQPAISLPELLSCTSDELLTRLHQLLLDQRGKLITQDIVPQIEERLKFLDHVGLGYLSLDRPTDTLSGGEAQRIRLASQLGSNLSGVLYVLDEPSIGLHAKDNDRLIETLQSLRAKGNTLLVVEHDDALMERADRIIDLGPAAGVHGGELLAEGTPTQIKRSAKSLTGLFLKKGINHPLRGTYRDLPKRSAKKTTSNDWLELKGASFRNLRDITLRLPLGRLIMVAGPSGAGKSTLFRDVLHPAVTHAITSKKNRLNGKAFVRNTNFQEFGSAVANEPFTELSGAAGFKSVIEVDQAPIGKTPRSTPATYLGIFDLIRQFFASLPESKIRGYTATRFSFNTAQGRCESCKGAGRIKLEMAFMPNTFLPCDDCGGMRYGPELADITWKGKTIGEVLQLTFDEAVTFFDFHSQLSQVFQLMADCGLGYLTLGQSSPTLSGGEAQRLKLVTELARGLATYTERSRGIQPRNLYLLEEPTIGLHLSDCEKLIHVLHSLVEQGHTVVVIEHHLDLIAEADYVVELGPEGGPGGGKLLYQGNLEGLRTVKDSPTAPYLRKLIGE